MRQRGYGAAAMAGGVALAVLRVWMGSAEAQHRGYGRGPHHDPGYVVAESHYGKGTVSGPIRDGRHGLEVRLPGGTWIQCVRSCADTLRRQTVDFFESNGPQSKDDGPGYFRFRVW